MPRNERRGAASSGWRRIVLRDASLRAAKRTSTMPCGHDFVDFVPVHPALGDRAGGSAALRRRFRASRGAGDPQRRRQHLGGLRIARGRGLDNAAAAAARGRALSASRRQRQHQRRHVRRRSRAARRAPCAAPSCRHHHRARRQRWLARWQSRGAAGQSRCDAGGAKSDHRCCSSACGAAQHAQLRARFDGVADVAKARKSALVPFMFDGFGENNALFQPDRVHPTAAAQPKLLDNVWRELRPLLGTPGKTK